MKRFAENPIIKPGDVRPSRADYEVVGAFNAGVARIDDEVILLLRVAERPKRRSRNTCVAPIWNPNTRRIDTFRVRRDDPDLVIEDERVFRHRGDFYLTSISHLRVARSNDGFHFTVDDEPALSPRTTTETFGLEDPRITKIRGDYWITYKAVSPDGITTALAHTRDFKTFTRRGVAFCPENLDVVIFPRKFDGDWVAWTRPVGRHIGRPSIWIARSPDRVHWGRHAPVLRPRRGMWDSARVGASTVPFLTDKGWLEIYHGANEGNFYCLGVVLVDRDDPAKIRARSEKPLFWPKTQYELEGYFGGVVFTCGADVRPDGTVVVYYGAADETTCAATTTVDELLAHLGKGKTP